MRNRTAILSALLVGGCYGLPIGPFMSSGSPPETIDGPESPELLERASASLVAYDTAKKRLERIRLSDLDAMEIETSGRVWRLTGPDEEGRILFVEDAGSACRLMLWTGPGQPASELDRMRGTEPFWEQSMFSGLALAPHGGRVAFLRQTGRRTASLELWSLEPWSLQREVAVDWGVPPQWLPDGRHVTFGRTLEPHGDLPTCGLEVVTEPRLYTHVLDADSGDERVVHPGQCLRTLPEAPFMLVWENDALHRVGFDARSCTPYAEPELPGRIRVLGHLDSGLVLYSGLATTGTEPRTVVTLQKAPQSMWTIKLADVSTGEFVTVYPYAGRFHRFSYGP